MDSGLEHLARRQGGAFSYRQALDLQGRDRLRRDIDSGRVTRVRRGIYRLADGSSGIDLRLRALQLQLEEPLVACGTTAAELLGFPFRQDSRLHVTTMSGSSIHLRGNVVVRQKQPREVIERMGLLMTSAAETTIDLACAAAAADLLRCLDDGCRVGVTTADLLQAAVAAKGGRGIVAVREWLPWAGPLSESPAESWVRQRLIGNGFTDVECQIEQWTESGWKRIDLGWRQFRIGIEYDGEDHHSGPDAFSRDRRRIRDLSDCGWIIVQLTKADLADPSRWLAQVRHLLESRGWLAPGITPPPWPTGRRGQLIPK